MLDATIRSNFENLYRPHKLMGCSPETIRLYRVQLGHFDKYLRRQATLQDLNDTAVSQCMMWLFDAGRAASTVNEFRKRILAIWRFLARKRIVDEFPEVQRLSEPKRIPKAWNRDELRRLFDACERQRGTIAGTPAALWWHGIHCVAWDTGERISALLGIRWENLDLTTGWLHVPAEVRKGQSSDAGYQLHETTVSILRQISEHSPTRLIFAWDRTRSSIWTHYKQLREDAGLETDRKSSFHRMRKSVASWLEAAGVDAARALGHSSPDITRKHYLDPRIVQAQHAADVLFRPAG